MRYRYGRGVTKKRTLNKRALLIVPVIGLCAAGYVGVTTIAPKLAFFNAPADTVAKQVLSTAPGEDGDRLFLPQINVEVGVYKTPIATDALSKGAWLINPENGIPGKSGNVIMTAEKFNLGLTPASTKERSPFYHLGKLHVDDEIFLDYDGERYVYKITKTYQTTQAITNTAAADESKLTLYSYSDGEAGEARDVIEAEVVGKVVWRDGEPSVRYNDAW